ncbi:Endo-1,4-beta-xylanase A precursor [Paenibacillus konkukensis]|uniref:Endo-1,4-beta-xylanase A n=1 Tax=Paenibacillus konkukensis TaxID=2020716 RepID=A0ABY4RPQ3_9BACL|nr:putative Ig domain-containing protein [Paenibacillus konkukensis]UQZ84180.1 Endo-1,4-beta-xylanase A precursor [Paenibacillus konkukensis]
MDDVSSRTSDDRRFFTGFFRGLALCLGIVLVLLLSSLIAPAYASAAPIEVNNYSDSAGNCDTPNQCTVRAAVAKSNAAGGANTIVLPAGTYELESGPLLIDSSVTIIGAGGDPQGDPNSTVIKPKAGTTAKKIIDINASASGVYDVTLNALTISGGAASYANGDSYGGAGISGYIASSGRITIDNCIISGNTATGNDLYGGGMNIAGEPGGKLTIRNTVVRNNQADLKGGGMFLEGDFDVDISRSFIDGNIAKNGLGGGLALVPTAAALGSVKIDSSTISRNQADGKDSANSGGGGIYLNRPAAITNTTISGNTAKRNGAGLLVLHYSGTTTIRHATVYNNQADGAGGGIDLEQGASVIDNSIVAGNLAAGGNPGNVGGSGSFDSSSSSNLFGLGGSGGLQSGVNGNQIDVSEPGLLPLAASGGIGETHALTAASPARGAGNNAKAELFDQRGFPRKTGSRVDIGAVEGLPDQSIPQGTTLQIPLTLGDEAQVANVTAASPVSALLPAGSITVTGSGASRTITVTPAADKGGNAVITVQMDSLASGKPQSVSASFTLTVVAPPDLSIAKSHTGSFTQGLPGLYTLTVTNEGQGPTAGAVTVTDALPAGLTLAGLSGSGWTCDTAAKSCTRADILNPGASYPAITVAVQAAADAPANVVNTASVSTAGDANPGNDTAEDPTVIIGVPNLKIAKSHAGGFVQGQRGAAYTIAVKNEGHGAAAGVVTVTDTLPVGLTLSAMSGTGWTCDGASCTRSDALAPGAAYPDITVTVDVAVNAAPIVINTAAVSGGGDTSPADNNAADPTIIAPAADLTISVAHAGSFTQGQIGAGYVLTVSNAGGGATIGTVTVSETLPAGMTLATMSGPDWTCSGASCTRSDALAPGAGYPPILVTVNVAEDAPPSLVNAVSVSGGGEYNTANSAAEDTTAVKAKPVIDDPSLHAGTVGIAYAPVQLAAAGGEGAYQWSIASGSLPAGFTLDGSTGQLGGTPTASGTFAFTVQAEDANGVKAVKELTLLIHPPLTIETASLPEATVRTAYSQTLRAAGGSGTYTWSVTTGSLPAGLTLDGATGELAGTPGADGTFPITVKVTDGSGVTALQALMLKVNPELMLNATSLPEGTVGEAYPEQTFSAAGGNGVYTWSIAGDLPAGLSFDPATAKVSGTPAAAGTGSFTVKVTDGNGAAATRDYTLKVNPGLAIRTAALKEGTLSAAYAQALEAEGGSGDGTYSWSVAAGSLPDGLTLAGSEISGIPAKEGAFTFTLQVEDGNRVVKTKAFTIQIAPALILASPVLPEGTAGVPYPAAAFRAQGGSGVYTWSLTGTLPDGLVFGASTQAIEGTPVAEGTASFTIRVTDGNGAVAEQNMTLKVNPRLQLVASPLPEGTANAAYPKRLFTAEGGNGAYTWSLDGTLPEGLSFGTEVSGGTVAGAVYGTPVKAADSSFTIRVTDGNGATASQALSLKIHPPLSVEALAAPDGTVGQPYPQWTLSAEGGSGVYNWSAEGDLPQGLTFGTANGSVNAAVYGVPVEAGTSGFTVKVTDGSGAAASRSATIRIDPAIFFETSGYTVKAGQQQQTVLNGKYSDTLTQEIADGVTYRIADSSIAAVNGSGAVTGLKRGTTVLQAVYGNQTAATEIRVGSELERLTLSQPSYRLGAGQTQAVQVTAHYSDGELKDVTDAAIYSFDKPDIARMDGQGVLKGLRAGEAVLSAGFGGQTATAAVVVEAEPEPSGGMTIAFGQPSYEMQAGQALTTVVSATYEGRMYPLTQGVHFRTEDLKIATVDAGGKVFGVGPGATVLSATYSYLGETLTAQAVVHVIGGGVRIEELHFGAASYALRAGQQQYAAVTAKLSDNSVLDISDLATYTVRDAAIAKIGSGGLITGLLPGDTVITATYGGQSAEAALVVVSANSGSRRPSSSSGAATPETDSEYPVNITPGDGTVQTVMISADEISSGAVLLQTAGASGTAELTADVIRDMLSRNADLKIVFQTAAGVIELPLKEIDPQRLAGQLGTGDADGLKIRIGIGEPDAQTKGRLAGAISALGSTELAKPLVFSVREVDGKGNETDATGLTGVIIRMLLLTDAVNSNTAAGVRWDSAAQQLRFAPAAFEPFGGNSAAKLNLQSPGTGIYAVLDTPVKFGDLSGHWARETVQILASKLIVQGRSEGSFDPDGTVTRAEWAALLVRALGLGDAREKAPFTDVDGQWFAAAVNTAYQAKLIDGYEDGSFRPDRTVTREELAVMMTRAMAYIGMKPAGQEKSAFADEPLIADWAKASVEQAARAGIIEGDQQRMFHPGQSATRAEAAAMLYRLLKAAQYL